MRYTSALRRHLAQSFFLTLALAFALASVGMTATVDAPYSIRIQPVLLRVDNTVPLRAHAFGVDIDVKVGSAHLHAAWSGIPLPESATDF